jgi:hypothetical protein
VSVAIAVFFETLSSAFIHSIFQAGADVTAGRPVITPVIIAASYGFTCGIKCLLEAGADANIRDEVSFCAAI